MSRAKIQEAKRKLTEISQLIRAHYAAVHEGFYPPSLTAEFVPDLTNDLLSIDGQPMIYLPGGHDNSLRLVTVSPPIGRRRVALFSFGYTDTLTEEEFEAWLQVNEENTDNLMRSDDVARRVDELLGRVRRE